ncbi:hypothetical protein FRC05_001250 [Tulasnella sp. 425]|nr:hypothetical protein FRC05_001250 [Tulasnella sp. 425]
MDTPARPGAPAIHKAPPEIIIAIIEFLLSSSDTHPLGRRYQDIARFTRVSSHLRNIAITTPSLWTRIEITDNPASIEFAKVCLQRSGTQKLDIAINLVIRVGARLPRILALVGYAAVRTRRLVLSLQLRSESQWRRVQDAFQLFASSNLDYLEVKFGYDYGVIRSGEIPWFPVPTQVPNLRSLVLTDAFLAIHSARVDHLKNLVLSSSTYAGWSVDRLWEVLDKCRLLETLELITESVPTATRVDSIVIPREPNSLCSTNLRVLVVKGYQFRFLSQLLLGLDAPELEEVVLGFVSSAPSDWGSLPIHGPFASVRLLSLSLQRTPHYIISKQLPLFLPRAFPNIRELALSQNGWPLLGGAGGDSNSLSCWTELRGLIVADSDEQYCDMNCVERLQAVKTFLADRSIRGLPRLKWAQVSSCWPLESESRFDSTVKEIQEMLEEEESLGFLFMENHLVCD